MKRSILTNAIVTLLYTIFLICITAIHVKSQVNCEDYHWEYEGETGPDTWATCFADCGGQSQSPIALSGSEPDNIPTALETHYEDVPIELINNGHTVEFEYEAGSTFTLEGEAYNLLQFHFHTGSEHTINGTRYAMEAHLVHQNAMTGQLAVIGVMFEEGAENAFLKNFSDNLPVSEGDHYSSAGLVNVGNLIPSSGGYYTYSGSLTTPPCSEIVTWIVMKRPVEASAEQLSNFHTIMGDNYRPLQDLNGRTVTESNCEDYHWEYEDPTGPDTWATCFADCGGQSQSPIALSGLEPDDSPTTLETHYEDVPIELINNGHTVEFEYEAGSTFTLEGEAYNLLQFHFHTGSEHTINGTRYAMEAHLVHQNAITGQLAVIGIMIEEGAENAFLKNFSDNLPASEDDHYSSAGLVNVGNLIPSSGGYYTYSGSLTTPPCSEIVTWIMMKRPVEASAEQLSNFHTIMGDNYRPLQDLNGRTVTESNCEDYHWEYEDPTGPDTWATCFADCGGQSQSPIALSGSEPDDIPTALETHYEDVSIELINNGHTVEFEYEAGSTFTLEGEAYNLLQFHFHTGSEHTINGTRYAMEAHLVHQNAMTGQLAVIGVMIDEGGENAFLKNFSDNLPASEDNHYSSAGLVNVGNLIPSSGGYYTYSGSLTTPPCSEIVTWIVMKRPVEASAEQLSNFHTIMGDNYRPLQDLNGRTVTESGCQPPSIVLHEILSDRSFSINWNAVEGSSGYYVRLRFAGQQKFVIRARVRGTKVLVTAPALRSYEIQIQTDCGEGNLSEYSDLVTISTAKSISAPINDLYDGDVEIIEVLEAGFQEVSIRPNPVTDILNVTYMSDESSEVILYGLDGRIIEVSKFDNGIVRHTLDLEELENGVYILQINTDSGIVRNKRIVKLRH